MADSEYIYVSDDRGQLFKIGAQSLTATKVGDLGVTLTDLAFAPNGQLYGISFNSLYVVDPTTARTTYVASLGVSDANALTFDRAGNAYVARFGTTGLYSLNATTGQLSLIGDDGLYSAGDLAYRGSHLYLTTSSDTVVELNPQTGAVVTSAPDNISNLYGLAGDHGTLLGFASQTVYALDPLNGTSTSLTSYSSATLGNIDGAAILLNRSVPVDLDDNGTSDIYLQDSNHDVIDWIIAGGQLQSYNVVGSANSYTSVGSGDFNGDGTADILFKNPAGSIADWTLQNGRYQSGAVLGNSNGYTVVGTGDFNGDATSDVLFNNASGQVAEWLIGNNAVQSSRVIGTANGYGVVGTGDFNGDGTSDVLLENGSGSVIDWIMQNGAYQGYNTIGNASGYGVVGKGDFNGDGTTDILLENGAGNVIDWLMKNGQYAGYQQIGNVAGYGIVGTGDYNGATAPRTSCWRTQTKASSTGPSRTARMPVTRMSETPAVTR